MSFNRLNYDTCTYAHNLKQSVGTADYMLNAPRIDCQSCFSPDPRIRLQERGGAMCDTPSWIDASSELLGITRPASSCPQGKYIPTGKPFCQMKNVPECKQISSEDTRLSNPPCTLRSTGWNRWEWLCRNPQDKALLNFDHNISNRLIVKDNHRPCIPQPLSPCDALPSANSENTMFSDNLKYEPKMVDFQIPSVHWRKCQEYAHYFQN